jgi:hypothetical protein
MAALLLLLTLRLVAGADISLEAICGNRLVGASGHSTRSNKKRQSTVEAF